MILDDMATNNNALRTIDLSNQPIHPTILRVFQSKTVGMSKDGAKDPLLNVFEWTHKHFPQFLDCRPIYVRQALESARFEVRRALTKHMWIPVEIILAAKK